MSGNLKAELRKTYRKEFDRRLRSNPRIAFDDSTETVSLVDRLLRCLKQESGVWGAFQPTGHEPDIRRVYRQEHLLFAFPRVESHHMRFFAPVAANALNRDSGAVDPFSSEELQASNWGVLEPMAEKSREARYEELSGVLVPGVAFDAACSRLGRGAGFYDRALAGLKILQPDALKIGVAFDWQIPDQTLPTEFFDVVMDCVVTESRCFLSSSAAPRAAKWAEILSERTDS